MADSLLTLEQAAARLRRSVQQIRVLTAAGLLRGERAENGPLMVLADSIDEFLRRDAEVWEAIGRQPDDRDASDAPPE